MGVQLHGGSVTRWFSYTHTEDTATMEIPPCITNSFDDTEVVIVILLKDLLELSRNGQQKVKLEKGY